MGLHVAHWKVAGRTLAPLELNEVMHTLELGIVTAGFIFMSAAVLSAAIFGRFFCSWGCHILALEDLCAWILRRFGIRPKPVRCRLLLLVPPAAMFYMFIWPQLSRLLAGRAPPPWRVLTQEQGWASFVTSDFWRNLPGPWVAGFTFLVCGFAIVYVLGSRSFCSYVCPYGAIFGLADRVAPGRIVLAGTCDRSGLCTAACPSHVRVHEEIAAFGSVVDSSCLRCLACVSNCPTGALRFGFTRPSLRRSFARLGRRAMPSDFSLAEEVVIAAVTVAALLVFRGLYDAIPFLLSLALGAILAYLTVIALRLAWRPDVRFNALQLKRSGRRGAAGTAFAAGAAVAWLFVAHCAFIRYHEAAAAADLRRIERLGHEGRPVDREAAAAIGHLEAVNRFGLLRSANLSRRLAQAYMLAGRPDRARAHLERLAGLAPSDPALRMALAELLCDEGDLEEAAVHLRAAIAGDPGLARARYNLGVVLTVLGRQDEALREYREALRLDPQDADTQNNLGHLLLSRGDHDAAADHLRRAIAMRPDHADAQFNFGRALLAAGRGEEAAAHLSRAAALDPRYAAILLGAEQGTAAPPR
jgi:tetratricopeptide (TPR) repeat protein/ferredoxin